MPPLPNAGIAQRRNCPTPAANKPRATRRQILQGRDECLDAGRVAHRTIRHRHVEIGAHQHPFSGNVEIVQGLERGHVVWSPERGEA